MTSGAGASITSGASAFASTTVFGAGFFLAGTDRGVVVLPLVAEARCLVGFAAAGFLAGVGRSPVALAAGRFLGCAGRRVVLLLDVCAFVRGERCLGDTSFSAPSIFAFARDAPRLVMRGATGGPISSSSSRGDLGPGFSATPSDDSV